MPDTVSAPKIAAVALARVSAAEKAMREAFDSVPSYSRTEAKDALTGLTTARELLALIAEPATLVFVAKDGETITPIEPPAPRPPLSEMEV